MNIPFFRRASQTFGLDIGSTGVRALGLGPDSDRPTLAALGTAPLARNVIADGTIKDPPAVVEAIRAAVAKARIGSRQAAIGVSGRDLIVKRLQIPDVPAREMRDAVQLEAEHHIPFAMEEVFVDYHVVRRHDRVMDLILVAAKRSKVIEYMSVVEEAGLDPVVVDLDSFAVGNQFELNHPERRDEAVALIDIGAAVMKTNVLMGGASIFARDIPFGGNSYTQAIAQRLGVPFERAESAKLGTDASIGSDALVPALEAVSRELSLEIQRTFDYFGASPDSERIEKIVLTGGCARLPGLTTFLTSTWGVPVEVARPLQAIRVDDTFAEEVAAAGPALAVVVGLGLRRPGDREW